MKKNRIFHTVMLIAWLTLIPTGAQAQPAPAAVAEDPLPAGWRSGYETDSVFNSRIFWVEAGRGHKETVVLIHGLGQNGWRDWRQLMPELAGRYRVIAFDLPGFGRSEVPVGKYSPANYAAAVHDVLQQAGIKRFHLIGHSMGGAVALRMATRYPASIDQLVLISAAGILERSVFSGYSAALPLEAGMVSYYNKLPETMQGQVKNLLRNIGGNLLRWEALPDPVALLHKSDIAWGTSLKNQPNINAALALVEEDFSGDLTALDVPTLVLWGEEDPVAPLRTGYLLAGQIPRARLKIFPAMGHMPLRYPDKIGPPIEQFLSGRYPSARAAEVTASQGDYQCQGRQGVTLSGRYNRIELNNCQNVLLQDVDAVSLRVIQSSVTGRNIKLSSQADTLKVDRARVQLTNAWVQGRIALTANASQLDLAGVHLNGGAEAVRAYGESDFVFSVSQIQTPDYQQHLHGVFTLGEPVE